MPRQARKESGTGIYHVMFRGINRQDIFEDAEDYMRMLRCMQQMLEQGQPPAASLHVLCLLSDVEPCTFVAAREAGGYRQYHQASDCDVCHVL